MSTTTHLLTWEAFEQLPDDATHKEILEGELLILPPPKLRHLEIATRIFLKLNTFLERNRLGRVFMEAGYRLSRSPASWVQPDVSFVSAEKMRETDKDGYFEGPPELSIEVISPSERAGDIQRKNDLVLAAGAHAIWVIYPKPRHVWVHYPGSSQLFTEGETLSAPEILHGFEMNVSALFED